ncbi:kynurenine formamidase [Rathayibacter sp. PhB127]|nr:kynurenine formamidase [Rathayibacter sp. PhB127]
MPEVADGWPYSREGWQFLEGRGDPATGTIGGMTSSARRLVDLSHTVADGLVTYPGLPAPRIRPHLTREESRAAYAPGTEFALDVIEMIGNTGTYLDSPFHRYSGGTDLAGLDLETLVDLPAVVVDARAAGGRGIDSDAFDGVDVSGAAVLLSTGWDAHFATPEYAAGAPFLTAAGAQALIDAGAVLVGIDSLNIDDVEGSRERPAHSLLLAAGVPVVEHLTGLDALPATGARFTAVPPKVRGFGTFPVRAFAVVGGR